MTNETTNKYHQTITTPAEGVEVVIKTMLTGAEREAVDNADSEFIEVYEGKGGEREVRIKDASKLVLASKHKLLQVSVVSINGDSADTIKRLGRLLDVDYEFVHNQIVAVQKKTRAEITQATPA